MGYGFYLNDSAVAAPISPLEIEITNASSLRDRYSILVRQIDHQRTNAFISQLDDRSLK
jgi:hypothetical protein